jgi:hypothetical protein
MEDIPLGEVDNYNQHATPAPYTIPEEEEDGGRNPVKAAAAESLSHWVEHYKMLMCKSVKTFHNFLLHTTWRTRVCNFVDDGQKSQSSMVRLFECDRNASHGFYTLKAHAVLAVRPERLMYVIRDHNPETRLAWDSQYVEECKELESFSTEEGDIKVVMTRVNTHIPFIWPRHNLGIAWYGYDRRTQVYKYVFRSTQHRHYKCPADAVETICLSGVIVRTLEDKQCELIVVLHVNPGNSFPSAIAEGVCKEWLRDRIHLYEKITKEWDKYYGKGKKTNQANTKG